MKGVKMLVEGRLQRVNLRVGGEEVILWNVYAPAGKVERMGFFKRLAVCCGGEGIK